MAETKAVAEGQEEQMFVPQGEDGPGQNGNIQPGIKAEPEPEVMDLDAEPDEVELVDERIKLKFTGTWVSKSKVRQEIRERYRRILSALAKQTLPGTELKRKLDDFAGAASKRECNSSKLIDRHKTLWGKAIAAAKKEAKEELDLAVETKKEFKRQDDREDLEQVRKRAKVRYDRACLCYTRAAEYIKDLEAYLAAEAK